MGGTAYKNALSFYDTITYDGEYYANFNLAAKYTTLSGIAGTVDGSKHDAVINIYGDGTLLKTLDLPASALPSNFSVNVVGVSLLKVELVPKDGTQVALAELLIQ